MSLIRRAVRLAALVLTATGLLASAPGQASDLTGAAAPVFTSLAAAVAAQDAVAEDESLRCLASAVYFESQGEPLAGQLAVAQVILNRTRSGRFAPDVCAVLKQRSQFGFVRGGVIPTVPDRPAGRTAIAVAKVALAAAWDEPAPQALYFHGLREGRVGKRIVTIGHHVFSR